MVGTSTSRGCPRLQMVIGRTTASTARLAMKLPRVLGRRHSSRRPEGIMRGSRSRRSRMVRVGRSRCRGVVGRHLLKL